ncbi:MAG: DUF456 domain-containing protein [bacterium]|nr:DUF456 domain-containing protein [bacterium]
MNTGAVIVGSTLIILGLAGCFLPVLPGPTLCFGALLLMGLVSGFEGPTSVTVMMVTGAITAVVSVVDYFVPILGARQFGATRWGLWGAVLGLVAGLALFPPFGLIVGALVGAVIGELGGGKDIGAALRAGAGVFIGGVLSLVLKLAAWGVMTYYFISAVLRCYATE